MASGSAIPRRPVAYVSAVRPTPTVRGQGTSVLVRPTPAVGPTGPAGQTGATGAVGPSGGPLPPGGSDGNVVVKSGAGSVWGPTPVAKGELLLNLTDNGAVGDGTITDDTAAINAAVTSATALGARLFARGVFRINSTVTLTGNCDLSDAVFNYYGTAAAVVVGTSTVIPWKSFRLPRILFANKAATGWAAGTIGVKILNIQSSPNITIPHVKGFETGVLLYGQAAGVVYNTIQLGHLENNKKNMGFDSDSTGWTNQNAVIGGRFSHNPAEGTPCTGTVHVWMGAAPNGSNNNTFLNCSLETPGVVEYMVDVGNSAYNQFINCRWEATSGTANVRWGANSSLNRILGGYNVGSIVETRTPGATRNMIQSTTKDRFFTAAGSGVVAENTNSSSSPIWTIMPAGADAALSDPTTAWTEQLSAALFKFKATTDTQERVRIDAAIGRIYFGPGGAVTAGMSISGTTATLSVNGGHLVADVDNSRDIGLAGASRFRYARLSGGVQTGVFTTAGRPAAATSGAGTMIFDSTLGKPVWSTGIVYVDATGATV